MSDDWMRPITKPLPGPVPTEAAQMSVDEQQRVVHAGAGGAHIAAGHVGPIEACSRGCLVPIRPIAEVPR